MQSHRPAYLPNSTRARPWAPKVSPNTREGSSLISRTHRRSALEQAKTESRSRWHRTPPTSPRSGRWTPRSDSWHSSALSVRSSAFQVFCVSPIDLTLIALVLSLPGNRLITNSTFNTNVMVTVKGSPCQLPTWHAGQFLVSLTHFQSVPKALPTLNVLVKTSF